MDTFVRLCLTLTKLTKDLWANDDQGKSRLKMPEFKILAQTLQASGLTALVRTSFYFPLDKITLRLAKNDTTKQVIKSLKMLQSYLNDLETDKARDKHFEFPEYWMEGVLISACTQTPVPDLKTQTLMNNALSRKVRADAALMLACRISFDLALIIIDIRGKMDPFRNKAYSQLWREAPISMRIFSDVLYNKNLGDDFEIQRDGKVVKIPDLEIAVVWYRPGWVTENGSTIEAACTGPKEYNLSRMGHTGLYQLLVLDKSLNLHVKDLSIFDQEDMIWNVSGRDPTNKLDKSSVSVGKNKDYFLDSMIAHSGNTRIYGFWNAKKNAVHFDKSLGDLDVNISMNGLLVHKGNLFGDTIRPALLEKGCSICSLHEQVVSAPESERRAFHGWHKGVYVGLESLSLKDTRLPAKVEGKVATLGDGSTLESEHWPWITDLTSSNYLFKTEADEGMLKRLLSLSFEDAVTKYYSGMTKCMTVAMLAGDMTSMSVLEKWNPDLDYDDALKPLTDSDKMPYEMGTADKGNVLLVLHVHDKIYYWNYQTDAAVILHFCSTLCKHASALYDCLGVISGDAVMLRGHCYVGCGTGCKWEWPSMDGEQPLYECSWESYPTFQAASSLVNTVIVKNAIAVNVNGQGYMWLARQAYAEILAALRTGVLLSRCLPVLELSRPDLYQNLLYNLIERSSGKFRSDLKKLWNGKTSEFWPDKTMDLHLRSPELSGWITDCADLDYFKTVTYFNSVEPLCKIWERMTGLVCVQSDDPVPEASEEEYEAASVMSEKSQYSIGSNRSRKSIGQKKNGRSIGFKSPSGSSCAGSAKSRKSVGWGRSSDQSTAGKSIGFGGMRESDFDSEDDTEDQKSLGFRSDEETDDARSTGGKSIGWASDEEEGSDNERLGTSVINQLDAMQIVKKSILKPRVVNFALEFEQGRCDTAAWDKEVMILQEQVIARIQRDQISSLHQLGGKAIQELRIKILAVFCNGEHCAFGLRYTMDEMVCRPCNRQGATVRTEKDSRYSMAFHALATCTLRWSNALEVVNSFMGVEKGILQAISANAEKERKNLEKTQRLSTVHGRMRGDKFCPV